MAHTHLFDTLADLGLICTEDELESVAHAAKLDLQETRNPVKCTRCRNVHDHSERIAKAPDKHGLSAVVCPRCSCHSYYSLDVNFTEQKP